MRVFVSDAPPTNSPGPNGPSEKVKSWQTVGSTVAALVVVVFALAAGTATASAAVTAARAAMGFRIDSSI
jgi:hypothetical protein